MSKKDTTKINLPELQNMNDLIDVDMESIKATTCYGCNTLLWWND